jgi:hypothetical protein
MSDARQKRINDQLESAIVDTDPCASICNIGAVIAKYPTEVEEMQVLKFTLSAFFLKYEALRDTAIEVKKKMKDDRRQYDLAIARSERDHKIELEATEAAGKKLETSNRNLRLKVKELEMKLKAKDFEIRKPGGDDGGWLSTKNKKQQPIPRIIPETQYDDSEDEEDVTPKKKSRNVHFQGRDTCMVSPRK